MRLSLLCGLLGTVLVLMGEGHAACDNVILIDGCTFAGRLKIPQRELFRQACNRHDVCYGCGFSEGVDRFACDMAFLRDMSRVCRTTGGKVTDCRDHAITYYMVVRLFGHKDYKAERQFYCGDPWVTPCLPRPRGMF